MRHYKLTEPQMSQQGFTDLFILAFRTATDNDFSVGFATSIVLDQIEVGDIIDPTKQLIEIKTLVTGPSGAPTLQITESNGGSVLSPTITVKSGNLYTVSADSALQRVPFAVNTATNLRATLAAGAGDAAAGTAGEIWIWQTIKRKSERDIQG